MIVLKDIGKFEVLPARAMQIYQGMFRPCRRLLLQAGILKRG